MAELIATQRIKTALFYGFWALMAWLVFLIFEPFLTPLVWATVLVIVFYPAHRRLERRLGPNSSAAISTVVVTVILIVPAVLVMTQFVHQALAALGAVEVGSFQNHLNWLNRWWVRLAEHLPGHKGMDLPTLAQQNAQKAATMLAGAVGGVVLNVAVFLFDLVITILAMFYIFRDTDSIMRWVRQLLPFPKQQREEMIAQTQDLVFVTVASSLAAAGLTGVIGGLAFWLVGIHPVVFWGVVMAFASFVPLVGAWMIWGPAAVWLLAQGHVWRMIWLVAICGVTVVVIDSIVRPLIISGRSSMNGLLVLIGVLGGIAVFGLVGTVVGPVIVAIATGLLQTHARPLHPSGSPEISSSKVPE